VIRLREAVWVAGCVGAMAVVLAMVWGVFRLNGLADDNQSLLKAVRSTQTEGSPVVLRLTELAKQIKSCTDPDGDCYKEAQERTNDIVGEPRGPLNTVAILVAFCADKDGAQSAQDIVDCVTAQLKAAERRAKP
jgi:hypothetical protein